MKALEKILRVSEILSRHNIEAAEKEAQIIVRHCIGFDLAGIYRDDPEIGSEEALEIDRIVSRRTLREPLQYIMGRIDFMGVNIMLGRDVLIPRPETEIMAEYAVKVIRGQGSGPRDQGPGARENQTPDPRPLMILDLCTGSGCIALALAREFPRAQVYGIDISEAAIGYAAINALQNHIGNAMFLCGTMFDALRENQKFDMIIANPPYIPTSDIQDLEPEIRNWEPRTALDGGSDGLDAYRSIIPRAGNFLGNNGILILELGTGLAPAVAGMAGVAGFSGITIMKDISGTERIFSASWTK